MTRTWRTLLHPAVAACLALMAPALHAHPFDGSITTLLLEGKSLQVEISLDLKDLERGFAVDANGSRSIDRQELIDSLPRAYAYLADHFLVQVDGSRLDLQPFKEDALKQRIAALVPDAGFPAEDYATVHIGLLFRNPLTAHPREVAVELDVFDKFGEEHQSVTKLVEPAESGALQEHIVLSAHRKAHRFTVRSRPAPEPRPSPAERILFHGCRSADQNALRPFGWSATPRMCWSDTLPA